MIKIHWDFTDGTELSYVESKRAYKRGESFSTHSTAFFQAEYDSILIKKSGETLRPSDLLRNSGEFTEKEIRTAHNMERMLRAGAFQGWQI